MRQCRALVCVVLGAALVAATSPDVLPAQSSQASVELGAARLAQREVPRVSAMTAGASGRIDGSRYAIAVTGGLTLADGGRSTTQGLLTASLLGRPGARTRWEIGGAFTGFDQGVFPATKGAYLVAREHFAVPRFGGWVGFAYGGVEDLGAWSPTRIAEFGSWYGTSPVRFTGAAVVVDTRSEPYPSQDQLVTDPVRYTDGSVGARWMIRRRAELDARAGIRFVSRGALTPTGRAARPFAAMDATLWVTPQIAMVAAMGRQLSDLARGTPDTRFASIALRFTTRSPAVARPPAPRPPESGGGPRVTVRSDTGGRARLVVAAPAAAVVELAASFTSWEPVSLVRRSDGWALDRLIPSGAHRVLVRVDRGPWLVPANLPAAADDFGGTVGIITIP